VDGCAACDVLDESLESLAHRYRGTAFVRARAPARGPEASELRRAYGLEQQLLPVLLVLRDGAIVGRSHLDMFGPAGEVHEEAVAAYLHRLRALREPRGARAHTGAAGAARRGSDSGSEDGKEEEDAEARYGDACEVCGRCYPHEHVRAVYRGGGGAGAEDGSEEEEGA
jgi:hypothetical protein